MSAGAGMDVLVVGTEVGGVGRGEGFGAVAGGSGWLGCSWRVVVVGCGGSEEGGTSAVVLVVRGTLAGTGAEAGAAGT